jgi:hypothetical protein
MIDSTSGGTWFNRFLAKPGRQIMMDMKKPADRSINAAGRFAEQCLCVRLHGGEAIFTLGVAGADTAKSRQEKQGKAADQGIGDDCGPHRKRERCHRQYCSHPGCRRQENQPYKHFLQLPRDLHKKFARATWQDCDPVLVNLRRRKRRSESGGMAMPRAAGPGFSCKCQCPEEDGWSKSPRSLEAILRDTRLKSKEFQRESEHARRGSVPRLAGGLAGMPGRWVSVGNLIAGWYRQAPES